MRIKHQCCRSLARRKLTLTTRFTFKTTLLALLPSLRAAILQYQLPFNISIFIRFATQAWTNKLVIWKAHCDLQHRVHEISVDCSSVSAYFVQYLHTDNTKPITIHFSKSFKSSLPFTRHLDLQFLLSSNFKLKPINLLQAHLILTLNSDLQPDKLHYVTLNTRRQTKQDVPPTKTCNIQNAQVHRHTLKNWSLSLFLPNSISWFFNTVSGLERQQVDKYYHKLFQKYRRTSWFCLFDERQYSLITWILIS